MQVAVLQFYRTVCELYEDSRRAWLEWRGRGQYVSVKAVRRAETRIAAETAAKEAPFRARRRR